MTTPAIIERFGLAVPTCCAVCRRRAEDFGYGVLDDDGKAHVIRCCSSAECVYAVHRIATMSEKKLDAFEQKALAEAGNGAGEYLDRIGRTDLAKLTDKQWIAFLGLILTGYEDSLRRQMTEHEAPF